MNIELSQFKAIIFDFDGVLADTEKLHYEVFKTTLKNYGIEYVSFEDHCKEYSGRGTRYIITHFIEKNNSNADSQVLIKEKSELFINLCEQKGVKPIEGVIDFLNKLKQKNVRIAISSGSGMDTIKHLLKLANIPEVFDVITSSNDVTKPKPDPEGFLITAQKLAVQPKDCLVFEDAINGINAAKSAGMKYIAIANCIPEENFKQLDPSIQIIKDFSKINLV